MRDALGSRFINAGVAEQNMVSVAAGLARAGLRPWVYSIAPFVYARPFEQIRNDVCLHGLPVVLVGNGGGYGYGVMGATHHALEDYGALLCLPHLRAYVPAFDDDVARHGRPPVRGRRTRPTCGWASPRSRRMPRSPPTRPGGRLLDGRGLGRPGGRAAGGRHLGGRAAARRGAAGPTLWLLSELPLGPIPEAFLADLARSRRLLVVEEHVAQGGVAQMIAAPLLAAGQAPSGSPRGRPRAIVSGRYGSQKFHRRECGLDPASIVEFLTDRGRLRCPTQPATGRPRSPRRSAGSRARSWSSAPAASSAPT